MRNSSETGNAEKANGVRLKGSQILLESLLHENVTTVFGYPGGAIIPVYDALYDYQDKIRHILVRHEQGAIHAAQGFARVSGKPGVVFATSGPGATNLVTGLADAMADSTPLVCITGQVYSSLLGTDAFQETDVLNITLPVTKWNYQVNDARQLAEVLAKAFFIAATGRPGPVLIDITKDAQLRETEFKRYIPCTSVAGYVPLPEPDQSSIEAASAMINEAQRPLVVFGQGVLLGRAEKEFRDFIERSGMPAAWTIMGMGALPTGHTLAVGMLGMHGNYAPNLLTNQCDVLVAVGMRFDDRVTGIPDSYAKQAKVIHFDIDDAEINKIVAADVAVLGDCKQTLPMVTALLQKKEYPDWLGKFNECFGRETDLVIQNELFPKTNEITMGEVINELNALTGGEAIIVTDVGQHQMVTCRYAHLVKPYSNVTSGGLGTMGFALPAAIGCAFGDTSRPVIAVIGDGGFQMTIQELGTIMQSRANVKLLILNNNHLGMVRQWQELFHDKRYSFVDIESPDFIGVAKAYNIPGVSVSDRPLLRGALKAMLSYDGCFLTEVKVTKEVNIFPMVPQGKSVSEVVLTKEEIQ